MSITMTAPMAQDTTYQRMETSERRKCFWQGWFINFFLALYGFFAATYIYGNLAENPGVSHYSGAEFLAVCAGVLIATFFYSRSNLSIGQILIRRTSKVLRSNPTPRVGSYWNSFSGWMTILLLVETFWMGWLITEMSFEALLSLEGLMGAKRIFMSMFNPQWGIIGSVMEAMVVTIFIALMSTVLCIPLAFPLSFLSARNLMMGSRTSVFIYNALRIFFNFMRSVEPLIWAIIFSVWVGIGPFAGMLALMIHSVASLAKLYSEQIENIDRGPIEAIEATGANALQVVWYAVVPQVVLPFLSFTIYRWDINVRMATIIGLVGGGGVGTLLMQYQGLARWNEVGTIVLVISLVVWLMDYLSARIREAIY